MEKYMRKRWLLLPLLALAVWLLATQAHPAAASDLVITGTTTLENQVLVVNGSVVIQPGGKLVLNNATIVINETSDFQYNVTVRGELDLSNGSKINTTNGYKYTLYVDNGTLNIDDSVLENIGGYYEAGVKAYGSSPRLTFTDAVIRYKGLYMKSLIQVYTDIDSDLSTLGKIIVNGLKTVTLDNYVPQNYMIDISGDTVFNITGVDFRDSKLTGWYDLYIHYLSTSKLPDGVLMQVKDSKADTIYMNTYIQTKLYLQFHNVTSSTLKIYSGNMYNPFNVNITNSTFTGLTGVNYAVSISLVSSLYIKDVEAQSIYIENTNATIRDTTILNPEVSGIEISETSTPSYPFSVNLTNIKIINVTTGYFTGDYSGVKISHANEYTVIRIENLTVTRKPGEENVPGICIGYAGGAAIYISDSVIPGIEIYKGSYGIYKALKVSEAANLFISNVNSSLDGKRIIVIRDTDGASVSGNYAQIFIYNSSNIEVADISFDTNIPDPLVIASSANVTVSNVNTSDKVFHSAILVGESVNVMMDHLNINSSTTATHTRSIEIIDTNGALIRESRIMGGSDYNYATTLLVSDSNIVIRDSLILSEITSGIAVGEIIYSNLEIVRSNITSAYKGIVAKGYIDVTPPYSLAIYYSNITVGYQAVSNDNRLIIQSSNLTVKTDSPSSGSSVLYTVYSESILINASRFKGVTGSGYLDSIASITYPGENTTILNSSFIGPAKYGVYVYQFTNVTGNSFLIEKNLFRGQMASIYMRASTGVSVLDNKIYSEPGYLGGIIIEPGNIDQTVHKVLYNEIDGKPILYLYNQTEIGLKEFGQVIAVMSTVEAENVSITGYPGEVQLYSSTMTLKNVSIIAPYSVKLTSYTDEQNLAVFKTQYGSSLRIQNSTLESSTNHILFEVDLGGGTGEGLVLNYTKINGTAYRLVDTHAPVSIGIYNSEINWNSTNEGTLYHEIVRMYCNSYSPGLEFDLVNTTVTITSSLKFDIEYVKRVYWRNVTIRAHGSSVSYYSTFLYNVKSARIDGVEFIGVSGIDADSSYVYITGGGVYNLSTGYTGLLYVEGYYSNAAFVENVDFRNVSGRMIYAGSSKAELGIVNVGINSSVDNNNNNLNFLYISSGVVYVGNFTANHSLGTPIYIRGGTIYMHYSALTNNTGFGLKATGGTVNVTYTYWGDSGGPNFTSVADADDPEEVYNTTTVYYKPVLTGLPGESDTQAPSISIVSPSDGVVWKGLQRVNVSVSDDHGVMAVLIFIDEQPAAFLFGGLNTTVIDTSLFRDGNHTLYAVAYDYAGHKSVASIHVKIENYYPSANITEPGNQSLVSGYVPVTYYVYDDNLDKARLYGNETLITSTSRVGYSRFTLDTRKFSDGDLWLKLVAVDKDGLTATYKIVITIDNTPPSLDVASPGNKSYVRGHVSIKFSTGDKHPGEYRVYLNGSLLASDTRTGSIEIDLDTTSYPDGLYNLTVYSVDVLGNENVSTSFFTIDNTPPEAQILSPGHGEVVSGTVDINVSASDNIGLERVIIYINGTVVFNKTVDPDNPTDPTYTYSWDTTNYENGPYNITVETIDLAGNTATSQETVNVNNATPVPESGYLALGVLGALLLAFFAARRRIRIG